AAFGAVQSLGKELLHGLHVGALVLGAPRHDLKAYGGKRKPGRRRDEDGELHEIDHRGRPQREIDQRHRHGERDRGGPRQRHQPIVARMPRDHTKDFPRGVCFRGADGSGDALPVGLRDHPRALPASRRAAAAERAAAAPPPPPPPPPPKRPPPPPKPPPAAKSATAGKAARGAGPPGAGSPWAR